MPAQTTKISALGTGSGAPGGKLLEQVPGFFFGIFFGKIGRSEIPKPLLSMGLLLLMGYTFELGGCGGSRERFAPTVPIQADGYVPEDVARQIRACAAEHRVHLGSVEHNIAFDITFANSGEVDEITLLGSTLRDEGLEACMASALRSLSGNDLPMRRADKGFPGAVAPESRAVLGQEEVLILACLNNPPCLLSLTLLVGATCITLLLYVHNIKTLPSPAPAPPVALPAPEPPKPEPEPAGKSKTTDPPPPPPPLPPPPPPPSRETCKEMHPKLIHCDDPKISTYPFRSENGAFNAIAKKLGKGVRKAKVSDRAERGPCVGRGGFHTNVLREGGSAASIVGCNCCDDSSGKAIRKQRADIVYK